MEGALRHLEAEAEPPRAAAIDRLEQRVAPDRVEQVTLRLRHDILFLRMSVSEKPVPTFPGHAPKPDIAFDWTAHLVHFVPFKQSTCSRTSRNAFARLGRPLCLAA